MTHFWGKYITDYLKLTIICLLRLLVQVFGLVASTAISIAFQTEVMAGRDCGFASSLLLRVRFARFTNVLSLAVEDLVSLLGGIILTTWMGLGTSSLG